MKKEKKMIWLLTGIAAVSLLVLCTVVIVRTATYPLHPHHRSGRASPERRTVRPGRRTAGRGNRIPTVSDAIDRTDDNPFQAFKAYLPQAYPAIYSRLDTLTINEYGLVFRWPGKEPGPASDPALFPLRRGSRTQLRPVGSRCTPSGLGLPSLLRRRSRRTDLQARHARHERHAVLDPRSDRLAACGGIPPGAGRVDRPSDSTRRPAARRAP